MVSTLDETFRYVVVKLKRAQYAYIVWSTLAEEHRLLIGGPGNVREGGAAVEGLQALTIHAHHLELVLLDS